MATYPGATPSDTQLYLAKNNLATTLNGAINNSVTTVPVTSTTGFPASGIITIDLEAISYTSLDATNFLGCTRGFDGTTAASHTSLTQVFHNVVAIHHNSLKDEIIAIAGDLRGIFSSITPVTAADTATSVLQRIAHIVSQIKALGGLTNWYDTPPAVPNAFQNILINGGFEFWQRGTSFTNPANNTYVADRWKVDTNAAANAVVTQESSVVETGSGTFSIKVVVSGTPVNKLWTVDNLTENLKEYSGKTLTVTARVRSNTATSCRVVLFDGTGSSLSSYHTGDDTWQTLTVTRTIASNNTSLGVSVGMFDTADMKNGTYYFDNVMLTIGSAPIAYVPKNAQLEFAQCLRYYEKGYPIGVTPGTSVGQAAAVTAVQTAAARTVSSYWFYKVEKRATPTIRTWTLNGTATNIDWIDTGGTSHQVATDIAVSDVKGFNLRQTTSATYVFANFGFDADCEL